MSKDFDRKEPGIKLTGTKVPTAWLRIQVDAWLPLTEVCVPKPCFFLFLLLLLFFLPGTIKAIKYGIPEIEYFNRRDYNGGTQNWDISQAENGLLYFANNDGILEFDGTSWRLLPKTSRSIFRSVLAHEGRIYVGAHSEFGFYEPDSTGNFTYTSLSELYNVQNPGDIWKIFVRDDFIVFQSKKGLCLYIPGSGVRIVEAFSQISGTFMVNGLLLVADETMGLMELRQGELFRVPGGEIFAGKSVGVVLPLSHSEMVIGTMDKGLYKWDFNGFQEWKVPANSYLEDANVYSGLAMDDQLVFGTIQSGLVITDISGNIQMIINKDKGLHNNTVLDVFVDQEKNIWAGLDNGIARVAYQLPVSFIQGYYDLGSGYCMVQENDEVFLGTNQGLYVIGKDRFSDPAKGRDDFNLIEGTNGQVWALEKDELSGELLCGHNQGVLCVEKGLARLISPPSVKGGWIFRMLPGTSDSLIVGTYNGLVLLTRSGNKKWKFEHSIEGFSESSRFIEWGDDGALWMAHGYQGLFKLFFNHDYSKVIRVLSNTDLSGIEDIEGFSLSRVDNRLLFTSPNGIYTLADVERMIFKHDELEKLFMYNSSYPVRMQQDQFGNVWFFANNGAGVLRKQEDGTYKKIDQPFISLTGKLVNGFESVYVWDSERSFIGIEDGFAEYKLSREINYYRLFNVHIRNFKSQKQDQKKFFIDSHSQQDYIPEFPFSENSFDVSLSATWFGGGGLEYSTRLDGFNETWTNWSDSKNRQFTRIPEGEYKFMVKARNSYGVESRPAEFRFIVQPPWHRSLLAKIIYLLFILGLMVAMWYITRHIAFKSRMREKIKQQQKYKAREEQMLHEALVNEKEMIRLRNEKLRNDMVIKEKELANSTMHIIQKNEFLIKMREELQTLKRTEDKETIDFRIGKVVRRIDQDINNEQHWEVFETHLEQVHAAYLKRLTEKHNNLSSREMKLAAYLRMDMSSKEIASLMNISYRAVENNRHKLRKKLGLSRDENLVDYILKV